MLFKINYMVEKSTHLFRLIILNIMACLTSSGCPEEVNTSLIAFSVGICFNPSPNLTSASNNVH